MSNTLTIGIRQVRSHEISIVLERGTIFARVENHGPKRAKERYGAEEVLIEFGRHVEAGEEVIATWFFEGFD